MRFGDSKRESGGMVVVGLWQRWWGREQKEEEGRNGVYTGG